MKSAIFSVGCVLFLLMLWACSPVDQQARDVIAGAKGAITAAEAQHPECSPLRHPENQQQAACVTIAKAIAAENTAIDALNLYCNFSPSDPGSQQCERVQSAQDFLKNSLLSLQTITGDVKGLVQ